MTTRDVGGMGHNDFCKLCDAAGLIYNSSYNKDAAGWDVLVEFQLNAHLNVLNNNDSQAIQCFVQVKATDKNKKSVSVKLSNLKRFCDNPFPCFFFFSEYEDAINPVAIYLVHFDKDKMLDVLKRLRECEIEGDKQLNRKRMVVKYDDSNKISVFDGLALKQCIESYIPNGMGQYTAKKTQYLKELGYEEFKYKLKFKLSDRVDYGSLVMASLGYENKINIKDISGWDNRFGIDFEISELSADNAVISFSDVEPYSHGTIEFDDGSERVTFCCDYYFSPIALNAPSELASYRVKCEHFDMLVGIKTNTTKINLSGHASVMDLYDLRDVSLLVKMLSNSERPVDIILRNKEGRETSMRSKTPLYLSNESKREVEKLIFLSLRLIQVVSYLRVEKMCKLSLSQLLAKEKDINILYDIIFQPEKNMAVRLQIPGLCERLDDKKQFYVLLGIPLILPTLNICLTVILYGDFTQDRDVIFFRNYKVDIKSKYCESQFHSLIARVKDNATKLVSKYESEENIYFIDSLSAKLS